MYRNYFKRMIDFTLALITLIIVSPILGIVSLIIKVEGKGKILFKQKRIGKNQVAFNIYKLRTMARDKDGVNRVTKIGKLLRVTSIDEIPQLINILKGEMSFIGPRPWIEEYSKYFNKKDRRKFEVLPGISGWAQVQGRNDMTIKQKLKADIWYVDHISFKIDIIIFFKTLKIVFQKTGCSITENGIQNELNQLKKHYNNDEELVEEKIG